MSGHKPPAADTELPRAPGILPPCRDLMWAPASGHVPCRALRPSGSHWTGETTESKLSSLGKLPWGRAEEFSLIIIRIKAKGAQLTLLSGSHHGSSSGTCSGMQLGVLPCAGARCGAGRAAVKWQEMSHASSNPILSAPRPSQISLTPALCCLISSAHEIRKGRCSKDGLLTLLQHLVSAFTRMCVRSRWSLNSCRDSAPSQTDVPSLGEAAIAEREVFPE